MIDPRPTVARYAALLVPGWQVTCSTLPPEKMPIKGALAVCKPIPTRSMAHLFIVAPWPAGESLEETIAHELTHAALSPFTSMLSDHPAAIMLEEQAVENIGKALAASQGGTARAMGRAVARYAPQLRARLKISTLATRARAGEKNMDASMVKAALDAIESGDGEKCKELLKALLAAEVTGEDAEPDGDEAPDEMTAGNTAGGDVAPGAGPPAGTRMAARKVVNIDAMRARKAADEMVLMAATVRASAKTTLIADLRARLGADAVGLPAIEKRIMGAADFAAAKLIAEIAIEMGAGQGQRARSGVTPNAAPEGAGGTGQTAPHTVADLIKEGFPAAFAQEYVDGYRANPGAATAELAGARARLGKAVNPWSAGANGAGKVS